MVNAQQDDAGTGGDAGNHPWDAVEIVPGSYSGKLYPYGDDDWYRFYAENGARIHVAVKVGAHDSHAVLYVDLYRTWSYMTDWKEYWSTRWVKNLILDPDVPIYKRSSGSIDYTTSENGYYALELWSTFGWADYSFNLSLDGGEAEPPSPDQIRPSAPAADWGPILLVVFIVMSSVGVTAYLKRRRPRRRRGRR